MRKRLIGCAGFLVLALVMQVNLLGQAVTGTLLGTVLDPTGAVVPNANVTLTNEGTGVSNHMATSAQGFYTFPTLDPGRYSVTVSAPGFKTTVAKGNLVQVEQSTRVDVTLSPGAVDQQVTVSGQNPLVETTTSDLGTVIDTQQINNLPVNGRLFQTLMFLAPGTTPAAWGDQIENPAAAGSTAPGGGGGGTYSSVNGFPFQGNLYLVDGVINVEPQNAYITIAIPFADIAEMKMETNNPTAEYGTFGGAVVNLTTKTGTNQLHGQLFEYVRNTDFNAQGRLLPPEPSLSCQPIRGRNRRPNPPRQAVLLRRLSGAAAACRRLRTAHRSHGGDADRGPLGIRLAHYQHRSLPDDCHRQRTGGRSALHRQFGAGS